MATPLELSTRRSPNGTPVVTAVGEIDMSNADRFRDALSRAAAEGSPDAAEGSPDAAEGSPDAAAAGRAAGEGSRFVVDLTGVEYLDSAGINALFAYSARIQLIASPLLAPVLTISGLSDITSVREPQD
jgi:anti-sigma B factor antagonist